MLRDKHGKAEKTLDRQVVGRLANPDSSMLVSRRSFVIDSIHDEVGESRPYSLNTVHLVRIARRELFNFNSDGVQRYPSRANASASASANVRPSMTELILPSRPPITHVISFATDRRNGIVWFFF